GTHLHPKDTGGTLLSVDQPNPAEAWDWDGPKWRSHVKSDVGAGVTGAEVQSGAPPALAERWAGGSGKPLREDGSNRFVMDLDGGEIRFVEERDGRGEGLAALDVEVVDREKLVAGARARGCDVARDEVGVAGIRVRLA